MSQDYENTIIQLYDWVRKNYVEHRYDERRNSIMLTNRSREDAHSGQWVVAEHDDFKDQIKVMYKRNGIAGVPDRSKSFEENTSIAELRSTITDYIRPNDVDKDKIEDSNPAMVQRQISEAKEDIKQDDNEDGFVIPSKTRGNLLLLRNKLEERENLYVEYEERQRSGGEEINIKVRRYGGSRRPDHHSGTWAFVRASNDAFDNEVLVGMKYGGVAGNFDRKKEFSFEVGTELLIRQVEDYI